jgi:PTH1 family peptidyl-tRNA hydrolase
MKLICCLGNPGTQYQYTRHNIGFRIGEALIKEFKCEKIGSKFKSILYKGQIGLETVFIQFPTTFMNLSGEAFQPLKAFYKIDAQDSLVVFDDFDIPLGSTRIRGAGSAGTHNGMKSVIQVAGHQVIPRLRAGIGPLPQHMRVNDFVLSNFTADEEREAIPQLITKSSKIIQTWITDGLQKAMNIGNN